MYTNPSGNHPSGLSGTPIPIKQKAEPQKVPYSLKYLRLKIFADFTGRRPAAKFFSHEISSS